MACTPIIDFQHLCYIYLVITTINKKLLEIQIFTNAHARHYKMVFFITVLRVPKHIYNIYLVIPQINKRLLEIQIFTNAHARHYKMVFFITVLQKNQIWHHQQMIKGTKVCLASCCPASHYTVQSRSRNRWEVHAWRAYMCWSTQNPPSPAVPNTLCMLYECDAPMI